MRQLTFPTYTPSNYRTGQNANQYYAYGPAGISSTATDTAFETRIRPDSYFLCRKIHTLTYSIAYTPLNGAINNGSNFPKMRLTDTSMGRTFQSQTIFYATLGGNAGCPNILPAPVLFKPASVLSMQVTNINGFASNAGICYEGEKIYNPDPAWVSKMLSRYWYQHAAIDTTAASTNTFTYPMKDSVYDFALCKILSYSVFNDNFSQGQALTGRIRIREKGPNNMYWSNIDLPNALCAGVYGHAWGAHILTPPYIIPGTSDLEIYYKLNNSPPGGNFDLILEGIKFPRGTNLEDWL